MASDAVQFADFTRARQAFLDGTATPRDFLESCIARIERLEPDVQAFEALDLEAARAAADESTRRYRQGTPLSALDGCPIGIKDIIETKYLPTGFGSPVFKGTHTKNDAACVQALRAGGAVIIGKTVTTEFAIGFSGKTKNPHDLSRTPGGSSSGSAAAVGCGMVPVSLGTQTNGSVLRPASYCGVIGFKGTFGVLPVSGVHSVSLSHDHLGVFGTTMDDVWGTASLISGAVGSPGYAPLQKLASRAPSPRKPDRLIRLYLKGWEEAEAGTRAAFEQKVEAFRREGIEVLDRTNTPELAELETMLDAEVGGSGEMLAYDMRWPFSGYVEQYGEKIGGRIHELVQKAPSVSPERYGELLARRQAARDAVSATLHSLKADAFIMPSASGPAPVGYEYTGSRTYLVYWSWLGFPAFSLPVLSDGGLPLGLQVMHLGGRDGELCEVAHWIMETHAP
jgi:Asp-tRNA(Asn)/Glu-tRNA(Gln) amidotransferase A subunit family amidase